MVGEKPQILCWISFELPSSVLSLQQCSKWVFWKPYSSMCRMFVGPMQLSGTLRTNPMVKLSNKQFIYFGVEIIIQRQISKADTMPDATIVLHNCDDTQFLAMVHTGNDHSHAVNRCLTSDPLRQRPIILSMIRH